MSREKTTLISVELLMYAEVTAGGPGKFHAGQVCGAVPEAAAIHFSGLVMESLRVAQEPI
jgi:hypothetical protein